MKLARKTFLLGIIATFLSACDSDSDSANVNIPSTPPTIATAFAGGAIKGPISGGTITVTDANGAEVAIASGATTNADGSYSFAVSTTSPIATPLQVTVTGGTAVCDRPAGCEGGTVAFGATFNLPADFSFSTVIRQLPAQATAHSGNINLATNLVTRLALGTGTTLSDSDVDSAQNSVKGLIRALTGVDLGDADLNDLAAIDTTNAAALGGANLASLALSAFSAAALDLIDPTDPDNDTLSEVIANLAAAINSGVDATTGNVSVNASFISRLAGGIQNSLNKAVADIQAAGGTISSDLTSAADTAGQTKNLADQAGDGQLIIAPINGSTDEAINQTRTFVDTLGSVVSTTLGITGAQSVGETGQGGTELLSAELEAVRLLASRESTAAFVQLRAEICGATNGGVFTNTECTGFRSIENGASVDDTEGDVTFMLQSSESGVLTITNATSTSGSATGVQVVLTIGAITHDIISGSFIMEDVTMTTSNEGAVIQTFSGSANATFTGATAGNDLTELEFAGSISGATSSPSFNIDVHFGDHDGDGDGALTGVSSEEVSIGSIGGEYSATVSFTSDTDALSLNFNGEIRSNVQGFNITANQETIFGTVTRTVTQGAVSDVVTFTDGTAVLTISVTGEVSGDRVLGARAQFPATFTVGGVTTGTLDENGVVEYTDGSVQLLAARLFTSVSSSASGTN